MLMEWEEGIRQAAGRGHVLEVDSPHGLSSVRRLTCTKRECGRAILNYRGNIYGSALSEDCVGA